MPVLDNIGRLVTCVPGEQPINGAAIAWRDGRFKWAGLSDDLPAEFEADKRHDAGGRLVVPGLVDCHTHLAFGGWRADEFALRCRGASYAEIARAGGGIRSTMAATRAASEDDLVRRAADFLDRMISLGVTTVEAKTGYGLSESEEWKLLRVYRRLENESPVQIVPTLLAAHLVPPEFEGNRTAWVELICERLIPSAAGEGLARFCDVFVEDGAFTAAEARRILRAGLEHGLRPKLHVDQLGDGGGGVLAAECGAASADHMEHTSREGMAAMARAGCVAVALPIASLYLGQPPMRGRAFIEQGCAVAVATDFNPGSAPSYHLPWAMTLACTMNGLMPGEALAGATRVAARAIGLEDDCGSIAPGKRADLAVVDVDSVNQWMYHFQPNAVVDVFLGGERRGTT